MSAVRSFAEWLDEQMESMSTRDRHLATGFVAVLAVLLVGVITWQLQSVIADRASRVILAKENLVAAQELADEYGGLREKVEAAESRMGEFKPDSMNTYLEAWAAQAGVAANLNSIQPMDTKSVGDFQQRDFRVQIKDGDLGGVLRFLHAIEVSPYPIKVRSAEFAVSEVQRERMIDLNLDLETFSKEGGS
jgi:hypothetical protein